MAETNTEVIDSLIDYIPMAKSVFDWPIKFYKLITGASDPMDIWKARMEAEITRLKEEVNRVIVRLNDLNVKLAMAENRQLLFQLENYLIAIAKEQVRITQDYDDQRTLDSIVANIGIEIDRFVNEPELWWVVSSVKTINHFKEAEEVPYRVEVNSFRHFQVYLSLGAYSLGVASLLMALKQATKGSVSLLSATNHDRLLRHVEFLSVRPGWDEKNPVTVAERVLSAITLSLTAPGKYVTNGECYWNTVADNRMLNKQEPVGVHVTCHPDAAPIQLCTMDVATSDAILKGDKDDYTERHGIGLMREMANAMGNFARFGNVIGETFPRFAPTPSRLNEIVYVVEADGGLTWRRVNPDMDGRATRPWLGPAHVGDGWIDFSAVLSAGGWSIYAVQRNGKVLQYDHRGFNGGQYDWLDPVEVRSAWPNAARWIGGGNGIVYVVDNEGLLFWSKHDGLANRLGAESWRDSGAIGSDWTQFISVFSAGQGVLYGVRPNGEVLWYRHMGFNDGENSWQGHTVLNVDAVPVVHGFAVDGGVFFLLTSQGDLLRYEHPGWMTGTANVGQPQLLASGLRDVRRIFALLPRDLAPIR